MSQEMKSQASDDSDYENSEDDMEDILDYYNDAQGDDTEMDEKGEEDPEFFAYELLRVEDVERLLNENVEALCTAIGVSL